MSAAGDTADRIAAIVEEHLAAARAELRPRVVYVPDPDLVEAAARVSEAVGRLDDAKYSRGEIAARQALERRARALQTVLKRIKR